MDYLLNASGLVIIFFLFYYIFLKNETFFKSIRIYFLVGLIIAVSIPLIEIPIYVEAVAKQFSNLNFESQISAQPIEKRIDWIQLTAIIYLIGIVVFGLKFIIQLGSLAFLLSKHQLIKKGNYFYVETSKNISPFSFFNFIIYNKSHFSISELEQVILHEKAHVKQWHSVDTVLAHLLVILLWFNPFVWLFKKAIQQNLEFLADAYALQKASNQKLYQITLLKTCNSNYCTEITNNFYNSLIKKRIIMLHKNRSKNKSQWKYALLIPALTLFIATFNTKTIAQEQKTVKIAQEKIEFTIDKNSSNATLTQESATFKSEFNIDLSFKGIKRNATNEITAIKIEARGENIKATFENEGNEAIKPIKIAYDSENKAVNIGNLSTSHKAHYTYTIEKNDTIDFNGKPNKEGNYVFISTDGDVNTWTAKSKNDTITHHEKIMIKNNGTKEVIWVEKKLDSGAVNVEVIELNGDTQTQGNKMIFIKEGKEFTEIQEDNASENVYIIKNTSTGKVEKKTEKIIINSSDSKEKPLIILNGKEISSEEMDKIKPENIESINVLKGDNAIKKYGDKGKNGVIEITKKQ